MSIELVDLDTVTPIEVMALHNDPRVLRHLPLALEPFDLALSQQWLEGKQQHWQVHGYGPWGIRVNKMFAGWGGLQYEQGDADLALVLAPLYWGLGRSICRLLVRQAFEEWQMASITALLPPSRSRLRGMQRLGFVPEGELQVSGAPFLRYRLTAEVYRSRWEYIR